MLKSALNFNRAKYSLPLYQKTIDPDIRRCRQLSALIETKAQEILNVKMVS